MQEISHSEISIAQKYNVSIAGGTDLLLPAGKDLEAIYLNGGLDRYFQQIHDAAMAETPNVNTKEGRKRIASLAASVSRSKVALEAPGREFLKRLKAMPKEIEVELRAWIEKCDSLRDTVRAPLTKWEDEIAAEAKLKAELFAAEALARQVAEAHEMALLMNEKFDRDEMDRRLELERIAKERDDRIRAEAADAARKAEEQRQEASRAAVERELRLSKEREEAARNAAAQSEARRLSAEKEAAEELEFARHLAEEEAKEKAAADAEKKKEIELARAADVQNRRAIHSRIADDLVKHSFIMPDIAILIVKAIASGKIANCKINY
jgi:hypothetical protein